MHKDKVEHLRRLFIAVCSAGDTRSLRSLSSSFLGHTHAQHMLRHSLAHVHLGLSMFQVPYFPVSLFSELLFFLSILPADLAVNPGLNPLAVFCLVFYHGLSLVTLLLVEEVLLKEKGVNQGQLRKEVDKKNHITIWSCWEPNCSPTCANASRNIFCLYQI